MSRSPDDAAATWLDSPGSPIAGLVGRLVAALNDWCEREQLLRELNDLEGNGELDRLLEEVGVPRGQILLLLNGRTGAARRLTRMMQQRRVDPAALWAAGELRDAEWRCMQCRSWQRCESWLARDELRRGAPSFCPNAPSFDLIRARRSLVELRAGPDPAARAPIAGTAAGGVLAELEEIRGQTF